MRKNRTRTHENHEQEWTWMDKARIAAILENTFSITLHEPFLFFSQIFFAFYKFSATFLSWLIFLSNQIYTFLKFSKQMTISCKSFNFYILNILQCKSTKETIIRINVLLLFLLLRTVNRFAFIVNAYEYIEFRQQFVLNGNDQIQMTKSTNKHCQFQNIIKLKP